jgi:ABC-type nitrate/sulfonate/bicarbonate transport system substrate-binding protein
MVLAIAPRIRAPYRFDRGPRGIEASNPGGSAATAAQLKERVASGLKIGFAVSSSVLEARTNGLPIKIVGGYTGESRNLMILVKADGPIKSIKDLDGKKIGIQSATDWTYRQTLYVANKFGIKVEPLPLVNITNQVVALKLGKVDAFLSAEGAPLRLVDSGELRIILRTADVLGKPFASALIYATED